MSREIRKVPLGWEHPKRMWEKIASWVRGLTLRPRRDTFMIAMPSGRVVRVCVEDQNTYVNMGREDLYGVGESWEDVGRAIEEAVYEHKRSALYENVRMLHKRQSGN